MNWRIAAIASQIALILYWGIKEIVLSLNKNHSS